MNPQPGQAGLFIFQTRSDVPVRPVLAQEPEVFCRSGAQLLPLFLLLLAQQLILETQRLQEPGQLVLGGGCLGLTGSPTSCFSR